MHSSQPVFVALLSLVATSFAIAQSQPATSPTTKSAPPATASQPAATPPTATSKPAPAAAPSAAAASNKSDAMEGLAAVYSDKLSGRKTASGQVFRQSELTAAHPSLPLGSKVKVTNTNNNKSVEVRINDRGPTQAGRVIDLSSAAAARLGMRKVSMAPVKLEVVGGPQATVGK
ncbi:MAG TPA: septal ring lytic transglycosylase RlpA family protein [Casimicrobiaceae bacterium]|nr:septal ring lytic transglycosylase RlpA family protein [Casimicrobiaceae bacterium]